MSAPSTPIDGGPKVTPTAGIAMILVAMVCISVNDMLIKRLSGDYPLHQMVFVRSGIGIIASLVFVHFEGGFAILRPGRPLLHLLRALMVVMANMTFFMALAVMPLAEATALFFVAPLFITLLSVPLLGERVGWRRLSAVMVGFLGVLVIVGPGRAAFAGVPVWVLCLPVLAALGYAMMQVLTRALRMTAKASAMAVYIQLTFLLVGGAMYLIAGDGRLAEGLENDSLIFVLRAWAWPAPKDIWAFGTLGVMSAVIGYSLSQAYRLADAATIAPYEYASLPLATFWGWVMFGTLPGIPASFGILLILGSGVFVFIRARRVAEAVQE